MASLLVAGGGATAWAQLYEFTTLAGRASTGSNDGAADAARFFAPLGVAVDNSGVIYVADSGNHTIRRISPSGVVTTLAGTAGIRGSADGTGRAARFNSPSAVVVDANGDLVVADTQNHVIRKVTAGGVVTMLAGVAGVSGSADGAASVARFFGPKGIAVDASGNVFVTDSGNSTIRKISAGGTVTTVAGTAGRSGTNDGTGGTAQFGNPFGVAVDGAGTLFVADSLFTGSSRLSQYAYAIRKITPGGVVTTLAKGSSYGLGQDGPAHVASIGLPGGMVADSAGNVIFCDASGNAIRRLAPDGSIATIAGLKYSSLPGGGDYADGTGANARFSSPSGLAVDRSGNVFVADTGNNALRKVTATGVVTTLAGAASGLGAGADGKGSDARFLRPQGMAVDPQGNVFVADSGNSTIRKITADGAVTTLAGAWGAPGSLDGTGGTARFAVPTSVAVDSGGNVFVADSANHTIRKITAAGVVTTVAGKVGVFATIDGIGSAAGFSTTEGIAVDRSGNLFVTESRSHTVRKVTPNGVVTTLAGAPDTEGSTDGVGAVARFYGPKGIAVDVQGNLFVADSYNHTIRKITAGGVVTTLAGLAGISGSADGPGSAARFFHPIGVALDGAGNIWVGDAGNKTIRKVTPAGAVTTMAGSPTGRGGLVDGTSSLARFGGPWGVAVDASGNVFVADFENNAIRRVTPGGVVTTLAGGPSEPGNADGAANRVNFNTPNGVAVDDNGNVFIADTINNTIRKITPDGVVTTLAGQAGKEGFTDGKGIDAGFRWPAGVAVDGIGNVFVADTINSAIRKITVDGTVTTLAGVIGARGFANGTGSAARFDSPYALACDSSGNLFVSEQGSQVIRKVTPEGVVTTLSDSAGNPIRLSSPQGLAVDRSGNVFVVGYNQIIKISPIGIVTALAGAEGAFGFRDGPGALARFSYSFGIAVDGGGNLFVADRENMAIRMITPDGVVTTIGGFALSAPGSAPIGSADGVGSAARFNRPVGIAADRNGNVFVADTNNNLIRIGRPLANPARLANVSVLASLAAGGGDTVTIGTIVGGPGTRGAKPLLVRAAGPSLAPFGVAGLLEDPRLEFFVDGTKANENDDWGGLANLRAIFGQVGAFPFATAASKDAALYLPSVNAPNNTVRVSSNETAGGAVLTELYDATSAAALTSVTPRLINVSVLKNVGSGLTAGFIIKGDGTKTVLIRAVGPSLAPFGVSGLLADPKLEVFDGQSRRIATNDNWSDAGALAAAELGAAFMQVGAFALSGPASADAALLVTLTPGNYTVQVRSADNTTGVALVEVYEVP